MRNYRNLVKKVITISVYSLYLLFLIVMADVIYKSFFEKLPPLRNKVYLQMTDPLIHRRSNVENLFYELKPRAKVWPFSINSFGMRDKEINLQKDSFRVIVLGDSVTFGPEVDQNRTFTGIAEEILNRSGKNIEILNAGVSGYNTKQEFIALREKYLKINPDLVIFAYCINDLDEAAIQYLPNEYIQKIIQDKKGEPQGLHFHNVNDIEYLTLVLPNQFFLKEHLNRWLMFNSGIYRFLSIHQFCKKKNIGYKDLQFHLSSFNIDTILRNIRELSLSNRFLLRFLILPVPPTIQHNLKEITHNLEKNNIIFWDFDAIVKQKLRESANLWVGANANDLHLNSEGHYMVGRLLANEIDKMVVTSTP